MMKYIIFVFLFFGFSFGQDSLTAQKQNTLYVQNLIAIEENIAKNFEKYILTEFKIPTISDLSVDDYLGTNFSVTNRMGGDIAFLDSSKLQLKYAVTNSEYLSGTQNYISKLYNRDLYRDYTSADATNSYVQFKLKSAEANTIFELLKSGKTVKDSCSTPIAGTYCNNGNNKDSKTIRWYKTNSDWIEYDKKDFTNGNVTVSNASLFSDLTDLKVGSYIFVGSERYIKIYDNGNFNIIKVD